MIITIIGSRKTPLNVLAWLQYVARYATAHGHIVRSGKAEGADTAAMLGCIEAYAEYNTMPGDHHPRLGVPEMYLPWARFGDPRFTRAWDNAEDPTAASLHIAASIHPAWHNCVKESVRRLHARNVNQILGANIQTPADVVVYWCEERNGQPTGGTATAVNLAKSYGIPCINLLHENWQDKLIAIEGFEPKEN